jgi:protein-L-isoaspartate(D-aspartate) O-methyltransferase
MRRLVIVCILGAVMVATVRPPFVQGEEFGADEALFAALRDRMVAEQIQARDVADRRVLAAMRKVPRHRFVPAQFRAEAYDDHPLPIGEGQTISQPYIVGIMSELMQLTGGERVLEVGTGSGYQAAVLAELAKEVYSIEILGPLARRAAATLRELGYAGVVVRAGDGYLGWSEAAPFDAIIVTAAPDHIPQPLVDQLKIGGRLVIPVGGYYQELLQCVKTPQGLPCKSIIPVRFVPLTGEEVEKKR